MKEQKKPARKCVGCNEMKEKNQLIRIVHSKDGTITVDQTGKVNGRGAYLCTSKSCLELAKKSHRLERALSVPISEEVYSMLSTLCD